ncbi:hypothetical protein F4554_001846 [Actinopolymorpha rutila]|uniref:Uncharacterized protein n=1 Tax=Actinopolymorpha rutila TaxID=446787 RepID=A0A852ZBQ1_9ACTN|nr:hypothetical protein [Actinopolymorpha rutila]NYH89208.1 hypothetical protein [Actinopolymorpha rutila]
MVYLTAISGAGSEVLQHHAHLFDLGGLAGGDVRGHGPRRWVEPLRSSTSAISIAPAWWRIIICRNIRSNPVPEAWRIPSMSCSSIMPAMAVAPRTSA